MASLRRQRLVIFRSVTGKDERLVARASMSPYHVKRPKIHFGVDNIRHCPHSSVVPQRPQFRRAVCAVVDIPLCGRRLCRIDRLNN